LQCRQVQAKSNLILVTWAHVTPGVRWVRECPRVPRMHLYRLVVWQAYNTATESVRRLSKPAQHP